MVAESHSSKSAQAGASAAAERSHPPTSEQKSSRKGNQPCRVILLDGVDLELEIDVSTTLFLFLHGVGEGRYIMRPKNDIGSSAKALFAVLTFYFLVAVLEESERKGII